MPLADDITRLGGLIVADLNAVYDYYEDTLFAWLLVQKHIDSGGQVAVRVRPTGTVTTAQDLAGKIDRYANEFIAEATFLRFVSLFEDFVFGLLRLWLLAHPHKLGRKQIPVAVVLAAPDLDTVKLAAVNRELNELNYQRVREWFAYLDSLVHLGCPTPDEVDRIAEMKATRDVLVHNRGVTNAAYVDKAGSRRRFAAGERMELPEPYHRDGWQLVRKVAADLTAAAAAKSA